MATYVELRSAANDANLLNMTDSALMIAALNLLKVPDPGPPVDDVKWAAAVLQNPRTHARQTLRFALADNKDIPLGDRDTPGTILGSTDDQIQAKVDIVVPHLVVAHNA